MASVSAKEILRIVGFGQDVLAGIKAFDQSKYRPRWRQLKMASNMAISSMPLPSRPPPVPRAPSGQSQAAVGRVRDMGTVGENCGSPPSVVSPQADHHSLSQSRRSTSQPDRPNSSPTVAAARRRKCFRAGWKMASTSPVSGPGVPRTRTIDRSSKQAKFAQHIAPRQFIVQAGQCGDDGFSGKFFAHFRAVEHKRGERIRRVRNLVYPRAGRALCQSVDCS